MAHIYGKVGESALLKTLEKREKVMWGALLVTTDVQVIPVKGERRTLYQLEHILLHRRISKGIDNSSRK